MTTSLTSQIPDSKILLYQTEDGHTRIEVQFKGDTVWLTQEQMAELFGKGRSTVNYYRRYDGWCNHGSIYHSIP